MGPRGSLCRVLLVDRQSLDAGRLGVELESALYRLYPKVFDIDSTLSMVGSRSVLRAIKVGDDPGDIARGWQRQVASFLAMRSRYLLYPDSRLPSLQAPALLGAPSHTAP